MHNAPPHSPQVAPENWDDLRFVLAVAETGTVSGAARVLGVNHATVLRRIAAFEASQGAPLFEKTRTGYSVPPDRLRVIEAVREAQAAVFGVARMMRGITAPLAGAVRITSTDSLCQIILPGILSDIRQSAPDLRFDLQSTNAHVELGRLQADIAVRPALALPDDLVGLRAARFGFAPYCAAGKDPGPVWLGISGPTARSTAAAWITANVPPGSIMGAADSFLILREMAAMGAGRALLPFYLGDGDARLQRLQGICPPIEADIWVASHVDLADTPRLRVVRELLAQGLRQRQAQLAGLLVEDATG